MNAKSQFNVVRLHIQMYIVTALLVYSLPENKSSYNIQER